MDLNLMVLCGKVAVDPEVRVADNSRIIRYLVIAKTEFPRKRVDVIPVTVWDPEDQLIDEPGKAGDRIWLCGSAQRRYWEDPDGRRSRIEIIAEQVTLSNDE